MTFGELVAKVHGRHPRSDLLPRRKFWDARQLRLRGIRNSRMQAEAGVGMLMAVLRELRVGFNPAGSDLVQLTDALRTLTWMRKDLDAVVAGILEELAGTAPEFRNDVAEGEGGPLG
jgi:hypothetical protein